MKLSARLLLAALTVAGSVAVSSPAAACDTPPKCASCRVNPNFSVEDPRPFICYN